MIWPGSLSTLVAERGQDPSCALSVSPLSVWHTDRLAAPVSYLLSFLMLILPLPRIQLFSSHLFYILVIQSAMKHSVSPDLLLIAFINCSIKLMLSFLLTTLVAGLCFYTDTWILGASPAEALNSLTSSFILDSHSLLIFTWDIFSPFNLGHLIAMLSLSVVLIFGAVATGWEMQAWILHNTSDYFGRLFGQTKLSRIIIRS